VSLTPKSPKNNAFLSERLLTIYVDRQTDRLECVKTAENYKTSAYICSKFAKNKKKKKKFSVYPF